jgi:hypothetical protein
MEERESGSSPASEFGGFSALAQILTRLYQAGFTSETIQQLFCNDLPESLRMEDCRACRIGGSRIHPEFLYLVEPSMDFLDERGQPVSPIQAALAAGYRRNPRLFPIFNEIQASDGDLVTYDELRNCSRPIVDCTQPTNYMIGLFVRHSSIVVHRYVFMVSSSGMAAHQS